jgi:hypothetical protein
MALTYIEISTRSTQAKSEHRFRSCSIGGTKNCGMTIVDCRLRNQEANSKPGWLFLCKHSLSAKQAAHLGESRWGTLRKLRSQCKDGRRLTADVSSKMGSTSDRADKGLSLGIENPGQLLRGFIFQTDPDQKAVVMVA